MAPKSLLSLRGEVNWVAGDYSNVIADTKRMVTNANGAALGEMRAGSRQREQHFKQTLGNIDKMEKESGERLVQAKKDIATRVANTRIQARTPIPKEARTTDELKKAGKEIDQVIKAAEGGYARLQGVMKQRGIEGYGGASFADDMGRFGQEEAGTRQMIMDANEESIKLMREERTELEKNYELMEKKNTSEAYYNRERRKEIDREIAQAKVRGKDMREIDRQSISAEKREREEMIKTRNLRQRLFGDYRQMKQEELQLERETLQLNREVGEELGRMRQEVGEGLRSAFVYATVAVSAFWYKLQPMVETFQEFENELINAQSIWKESNDVLFELSDQVVEFGQNFGINMGQATEGLYQYASAGVEAAEAMEMLNHTLQLSMAVQGDHNTLAKLTTQTIMGFGMEFSDAAVVTDKFAHAINKSLIEWDDLASSIKFALPFFTSTGQSLDQLLGALSVLTNRALEAGIAGRGLRQALAEFTQHAEDNAAAFRQLGVEILDVEGNMYPLDQIAQQFSETLGEQATDMEVMIALMEDLNVRGATAFIHLVQGADEYSAAVADLQNSSGEAHEMAMVQQESLAIQIQLLKNALLTPFLLADEAERADGHMNQFLATLHNIVGMFEDLVVVGEDGNKTLTEIGEFMRDFVIVAMEEFALLMMQVIDLVKEWESESDSAYGTISLLVVPLNALLKVLKGLGPHWINTIMFYRIMNTLLPMHIGNTIHQMKLELQHIAIMEKDMAIKEAELAIDVTKHRIEVLKNQTTYTGNALEMAENDLISKQTALKKLENAETSIDIGLTLKLIGAKIMLHASMFALVAVSGKFAQESPRAAFGLSMIAGALGAAAIAYQIFKDTITKGSIFAALALGAIAGIGFHMLMKDMMAPPDMSEWDSKLAGTQKTTTDFTQPLYDTGGRVLPMYATGGRPTGGAHFPVLVEPGETIISKTQNMLDANTPNVVVNIGDVYAEDGTDFADKLAEALPTALQRQSYTGGF